MKNTLAVAVIALFFGCSGERPSTPREAAVGPVKILQFYASPGTVARGEPVSICYGVENAQAVRLQPNIEEIRPSPNRCFQIKPLQDATYSLIADGLDGKQVSESLTIQVKSAGKAGAKASGGLFTMFLASATEVGAGQSVTVCYGVQDAASARIEPEVGSVPPREKNCVVVRPSRSATYKLVATGPAGKTDSQELKITVQ
jgi:hypothetical protein